MSSMNGHTCLRATIAASFSNSLAVQASKRNMPTDSAKANMTNAFVNMCSWGIRPFSSVEAQASKMSFRPPWTLALQARCHCSPKIYCSPNKSSSVIRWSGLTKVSWNYKSSCVSTSLTMGALHSPLTFGWTTPHRRRTVLTPYTWSTIIGSCMPTSCLVMNSTKARTTPRQQFITTLLTASTRSYPGRRTRWRFRWRTGKWWSSQM